MFVCDVSDSDQQVVLDLVSQDLNIPNNFFRNCIDQDLALLLRTSLVDHESDLCFAV